MVYVQGGCSEYLYSSFQENCLWSLLYYFAFFCLTNYELDWIRLFDWVVENHVEIVGYSKIPIIRPPLRLSKSGLKDHLDSPKSGP